MKSVLLFMLLLPALAKAQTFAGMGIGNHYAVNAYAGYAWKKTELSIGYYASAFVGDMPVISYVKGGYTVGMFTMAAGAAKFTYSDDLKLLGKTGFHPLFGLEFGKKIHGGKLYSNATYTGNLLYISAGIRAYIK